MGYGDKIGTMRGELRALYQAAPAATTGFSALTKGVMDSGPLGRKEKEFIALGMALALRCEPCINFHVEALIKAGASREELVDVLGVAIQMGGGPAVMYTGHALACWDELTAARG
ncbi:MAG: carboxymuconolactone decarboxylase family protein [Alphaproteobacteria bacterium HGW-Alphaproteobacteria-6]|nr:MAG: carboxymuconolactone decarboxylase family protein [Alphaproteobacteria bacterium HGW-Alphaproteobacteria-6]